MHSRRRSARSWTGGTVSEVIASHHKSFAKGDIVVGYTGWQDYAVSSGRGLRKVDPALAPISTALGVLGMPGMTAYTGLLDIGQPKAGETLVVAAASGAVGAIVGQIAKFKGCRAVGIAGGAEKCPLRRRRTRLRCLRRPSRAAISADKLKAACPKGIDVYFENVGGKVLEACFPLLNLFARVPVCGLIAQYNATSCRLVPTGRRSCSALSCPSA